MKAKMAKCGASNPPAQARKARMEALKQREKERQEMIEVLTWLFIVVVVWGGLGYGAYYWFTK